MRNQIPILSVFLLAACGFNNISTGEESFPVTIERVPPQPRDGALVRIRWTTKVAQSQGKWFMHCAWEQPVHKELNFSLPWANIGSSGTADFGADGSYTCVVRNAAQEDISNALTF